MREKSTTFFESSSTTDQSPAWKPSSTKHRKGKGITWWHLMFSPLWIPGSWWTYTAPYLSFLRIHSIYKPSFTDVVFANHSQKWWCSCIISSVPLLSIFNLITSKKMAQQSIPYLSPENCCGQNDNQFLKDFRRSSQGHGCPVFPRRIGTHVLQPRVGCFMWHLSDADCPPKRWFCGKKYRRWEKLVNISTIRSRYVGDFILRQLVNRGPPRATYPPQK